jgi:hypothetical protein
LTFLKYIFTMYIPVNGDEKGIKGMAWKMGQDSR